MRNLRLRSLVLVTVALLAALTVAACGEKRGESEDKSPVADGGSGSGWCKGTTIRFFNGSDPGDPFGTIVHNGAKRAQQDTGAKVEFVYSGWDPAKMVDQLRQAIEEGPDGIAMMGHPGDAAIKPLAEKAASEGVLMQYQNVDVPETRAQFGGGYVGSDLARQGAELAERAVQTLGLKEGDQAIVFGPFGDPARAVREQASADALEKAGLEVETVNATPKASADPNLLTPVFASAVGRQDDTKLVVLPGGPYVGAADQYLKAAGKEPGEIKVVGFDLTPSVIKAFEIGAAQLVADQEPFLQGYLPIVSLCMQKTLGLAPITVDTSAGFVDESNYESVKALAQQGLR
jgi:simple sugar transport system substrate-binding protein